MTSKIENESVKVLRECIELQLRKSKDYQNPNSNVVQAMHYRRGIDTIHDILNGKMLRAQSLLEAAASGHDPNYESIEDTYKDMINYASFAVSWLRGSMEGQKLDCDIFNRRIKSTITIDESDKIIEDLNIKENIEDKITIECLATGYNPQDDDHRKLVRYHLDV